MEEIEYDGFDKVVAEAVTIAEKRNWGYSKFKKLVSQFIKKEREMDVDDWVFDFVSYVIDTKRVYQHPLEWAEEYYQKDFKHDKYKKFLADINPH